LTRIREFGTDAAFVRQRRALASFIGLPKASTPDMQSLRPRPRGASGLGRAIAAPLVHQLAPSGQQFAALISLLECAAGLTTIAGAAHEERLAAEKFRSRRDRSTNVSAIFAPSFSGYSPVSPVFPCLTFHFSADRGVPWSCGLHTSRRVQCGRTG
jgi:hypothetical protein